MVKLSVIGVLLLFPLGAGAALPESGAINPATSEIGVINEKSEPCKLEGDASSNSSHVGFSEQMTPKHIELVKRYLELENKANNNVLYRGIENLTYLNYLKEDYPCFGMKGAAEVNAIWKQFFGYKAYPLPYIEAYGYLFTEQEMEDLVAYYEQPTWKMLKYGTIFCDNSCKRQEKISWKEAINSGKVIDMVLGNYSEKVFDLYWDRIDEVAKKYQNIDGTCMKNKGRLNNENSN